MIEESSSIAELLGESDLTRAFDEMASCAGVIRLEANLFEISFQAPALAAAAAPGEFAQIWVGRSPVPLLRRPFSFSRVDAKAGTVSFYLGAVGEGSRRLLHFRPGDPAQILGPLGRGFTIPEEPGQTLIVAGGLGAAPFPFLAQRLIGRGERVVWLNGARSAPELYPESLIPEGLAELVCYTEDGSSGRPGKVTQDLLQRLPGVQRLYACGPNPMLASVAQLVREHRSRAELVAEASIEAPMGCGFGTCLGCAIPLSPPGPGPSVLGLCCRQGPVLDPEVVDWPNLLRQPAHLT